MMEPILTILACWAFIYWLPGFLLIIYIIRREDDIRLGTLWSIMFVTMCFGPIFPGIVAVEELKKRGVFDKVVIKQNSKRKVWQALGGKD